MSNTIGELVVIALKAENLPSRVPNGPQDPFCIFKLGSVAKKTKIDKRGGQNPIWDDQVNLPVPGGTTRLFVQIFNRQAANENLISEGHVDLHEVLRKGEHDGFFPLIFNGKQGGRIYLELTFYASQVVQQQPPPIRYYSANPYPNQRPPPPHNVRPPPPHVRPMHPVPQQQHFHRPPPPPSNMRPAYPNMQMQPSVSAPNQRLPPPSHGQPSPYHPPPPRPIRQSTMPSPQSNVIPNPFHPPPQSTSHPTNGFTSRPPPPQQQLSYSNSISQRPLPVPQQRPPLPHRPQQQPYYSNQPPPPQQHLARSHPPY
ncbi:C2 domain-containing protein [Cunninghamella echinulata]|nr:C2 domain-containing protein [Cunninghamella echinulata]